MEIDHIAHKGLRRFFETGNAKGLVGDAVRLRKMLAFIDAAGSIGELAVPPILRSASTYWQPKRNLVDDSYKKLATDVPDQ